MATNELRKGVLTSWETLAQSIAGIAPSATPGMLIPIVFGFAGNGTWLSYVLATIGILFTAHCINEFTSRSASPGSLYSFVREGLGSGAGTMTGWALLFAYVFCTAASIVEFAAYACSLTKHILQWELNSVLMIGVGMALVAYIAYKNIKMSASLMLRLEFLSVGLILVIVALVLWKLGFSIDSRQLSLSGVSFENVRMGLVMAIFGFVAFESSASLGVEADKPLINIPRAIMRSVVFSGLFFVVTSYAMVRSFEGNAVTLDKCATPLLVMSGVAGYPSLGHLVDAGIMVSFFAAALANMNAAARAVYQMSRDGVLDDRLGDAHATNGTPYAAIVVCSTGSLIVAAGLACGGAPLLDIVGWLGTLATFGFIYGYMATSVAAWKLLKTIGELKAVKIIVACLSLAVLLFALIGSLLPVPAFPYNVLPFVFLSYMVVGGVWCSKQAPQVVASAQPVQPVD